MELKDSIPVFRRYSLVVSIVTIFVLVNYQFKSVYYSYIISGGKGEIGLISGLLLFLLYTYVSFELTWLFFKDHIMLVVLLTFIQPLLVSLFFYCDYYNDYSDRVKDELLMESHVRLGYVHKIRSPLGRGTYHKEIKLGIDNEHISKHDISDDDYKKIILNVGDTVLLRVSDEYPRVTEVLKWKPTHEEIERYKTPRKFKSYINGTIYEEDE